MNKQNLKPIQSKDKAREKGKLGGIASGKSRREKRKMRQILTELLTEPKFDTDFSKEELAIALIRKAQQGDIHAFETIMKFIGDMPSKEEQQRTDEEIKENPFGVFF